MRLRSPRHPLRPRQTLPEVMEVVQPNERHRTGDKTELRATGFGPGDPFTYTRGPSFEPSHSIRPNPLTHTGSHAVSSHSIFGETSDWFVDHLLSHEGEIATDGSAAFGLEGVRIGDTYLLYLSGDVCDRDVPRLSEIITALPEGGSPITLDISDIGHLGFGAVALIATFEQGDARVVFRPFGGAS